MRHGSCVTPAIRLERTAPHELPSSSATSTAQSEHLAGQLTGPSLGRMPVVSTAHRSAPASPRRSESPAGAGAEDRTSSIPGVWGSITGALAPVQGKEERRPMVRCLRRGSPPRKSSAAPKTRCGLSSGGSAAWRSAPNREQRGPALRAVALPAGTTVGQGHLPRVGDRYLLAADAPALRAGVLGL